MTTRDTPWAPGTPCWVDNISTDGAAARAFYSALFGWTVEEGPPEAGGYSVATLGGRNVAGIMGEAQLEHPAVWTTYLATVDSEATCEKITAAGGTLLQPNMDVMGLGNMAVAQDPTGAIFGIWEAKLHTGFQLANEPGSVTWNEVLTRDVDAAKAFYADVFGYKLSEFGDSGYFIIEVDGNGVGGLGSLPDAMPAEVPAHWRTYFAVADCDESTEQAVSLGATVLMPPTDMPYGRHSDIVDPNGSMLSLLKGAEPQAE